MGKRIIQQARGKGSLTYRVRKKAYRYRISYPSSSGTGTVLKLINSPAHTCPLAKIKVGKEIFYNIAVSGLHEGQVIEVGSKAGCNLGNILPLENVPVGTTICNIETKLGAGGKLVRSSGISARVVKKTEQGIFILMPSKQERLFDSRTKATIGVVAAAGRLEKPIVKAGKKWHMMHARSKLWPRTSAVKFNAIDHPFGSGRGKRIKSKIPKSHAPPGKKVGLLRPKRTGRRKK